MLELANAGAYRQNCSFHCLAHVWMDFLKRNFNDIETIMDTHPIYHAILAEVNDYYQLKDLAFKTFAELVKFDDQLPNPIDREIFWGTILRNVLRDFVLEESQKHKAKNDTDMDDNVQARLAHALGASVHFYAMIDDNPIEMDHFQATNKLFDVHIYHTSKGGGHFDFSFYNGDKQDTDKNVAHNKQLQWQQNANVKRFVPNGNSWFAQVYSGHNTMASQIEFIRQRVQSNLRLLKTHHQAEPIIHPHKPLPQPPGVLVHRAQKRKPLPMPPQDNEASLNIYDAYKASFTSLRTKCNALDLPQACEQMATRHLAFLISTLLELNLDDKSSLEVFISDAAIEFEEKISTRVSEATAELMAKQDDHVSSSAPKRGFLTSFKRQEPHINPDERILALEMAVADLTSASEPANATNQLKHTTKNKL